MDYKYFNVYIASTDDFESPDDMLAKINDGDLSKISEFDVSFRSNTEVIGYDDEHPLLAETIAWGEASDDWSRDNTITIVTSLRYKGEVLEEEKVVRVDVR